MKKIVAIFGIITMMLCTSFTIPILAESNNTEIFGRTHIKAIGSFAICEEEQILYGHIFIGRIGFRPVFNLNIEICKDSIKRIVMVGNSINPGVYIYLNCVIKE